MPDIFTPEALDAQLKKLPDLPANEGGVGVVATKNDIGVKGQVNVDVGKPGGWFVLAEGSWMRRAGATVSGWVGWKGKESK